ncbi:hypothetical protein [Pseudomonas orientalis]|uniref:Uncharacterized protein n=1 Tax=Pseudomonas orientalis TaxID=76758 RepID=A0A2L0RTT4_9PSED|nr:hypothetical protein [Pseudomonas orientalis]AUZ45356.1 hypothetical protein BOP93_07015 [Pseudomonas orientalis]
MYKIKSCTFPNEGYELNLKDSLSFSQINDAISQATVSVFDDYKHDVVDSWKIRLNLSASIRQIMGDVPEREFEFLCAFQNGRFNKAFYQVFVPFSDRFAVLEVEFQKGLFNRISDVRLYDSYFVDSFCMNGLRTISSNCFDFGMGDIIRYNTLVNLESEKATSVLELLRDSHLGDVLQRIDRLSGFEKPSHFEKDFRTYEIVGEPERKHTKIASYIYGLFKGAYYSKLSCETIQDAFKNLKIKPLVSLSCTSVNMTTDHYLVYFKDEDFPRVQVVITECCGEEDIQGLQINILEGKVKYVEGFDFQLSTENESFSTDELLADWIFHHSEIDLTFLEFIQSPMLGDYVKMFRLLDY